MERLLIHPPFADPTPPSKAAAAPWRQSLSG
jgi:hypothetical protein